MRLFFEGAYQLHPEQLKVIRIYECPDTNELKDIYNLDEPPLQGVGENGLPAGAKKFLFTDPKVNVYVFAMGTANTSSCIFALQVNAIVETHVFGSTLADGCFSVQVM